MNLKVLTWQDQKLTLLQSIQREFLVKIISYLIFCIGFLWILWDENNQTWHDILTQTYVVTTMQHQLHSYRSWFIGIILLIILPTLSVIISIFIINSNSSEVIKQSRDKTRIDDINNLNQIIKNISSKSIGNNL